MHNIWLHEIHSYLYLQALCHVQALEYLTLNHYQLLSHTTVILLCFGNIISSHVTHLGNTGASDL